ncbi:MAG: hypothetical protein F4181_06645 [Proteobacteria bacterium]|nr:hypothetical protein [Pseudomonadota bacterium]
MKPTILLRLLSLAGATLALALSTQSGQAQEWSQYLAFDDRFSVDFPTDPSVEETTYETEYGFTLPARIYTTGHAAPVTFLDIVGFPRRTRQTDHLWGAIRAALSGSPPHAVNCREFRSVQYAVSIAGFDFDSPVRGCRGPAGQRAPLPLQF